MIRACSMGAALLLLALGSARAERLVTSLSDHQVLVTQNFTGEHIVLFGAIEQDGNPSARAGAYDVVITVTGPRQTLVTRRKDRVVGLWFNVDSRDFIGVPSYLAVFANKPLNQIATPDILRRLQVGLDNFILPQRIGPDVADVVPNDPFRSNFIRIQERLGLYIQQPNAVTFLSPSLFRSDIPLPAEVPLGTYQVDVKLFAAGAMVARDTSAMEVLKVGFEQFVATTARTHGLIYGVVVAMMAFTTGWLASVIFRRD